MNWFRKFLSWLDEMLEDELIGVDDPEMIDVSNFQAKFGHLTQSAPGHLTKRKLRERLECMREELDEFELAIESQDLAGQADALIDLVYFAKGTANMLGLHGVWVAMWSEVQRANMDKLPGVGKRGHAVDVIKPPDWRPPQHDRILDEAGYRREDYEANGSFLECYCVDDEVRRG